MYFVDRTAVVLKPTVRFLDWLNHIDEEGVNLTLEQLRTNCSVFLVPEFETPEEVVAYFDERYVEVFKAEVSGWAVDEAAWPKDMSLKAFWEFFEVEIHDLVVDMEEGELSLDPVFDDMV